MSEALSQAELDIIRDEHGYLDFYAGIRRSFSEAIADPKEPLFRTDAENLYDLLLQNLPEEHRKEYTCSVCRNFVRLYGGLVRIDDKGKTHSLMWSSPAPAFFAPAAKALVQAVEGAAVTGVFLPNKTLLGTRKTGIWDHMYVEVPKDMLYSRRLKNAEQKEAEKAEERKMLRTALEKFQEEHVKTAVSLLRSGGLYRSEQILGMAEWFLKAKQEVQGKYAGNLLWKKAATAPTGFCHVSSSMLGTLLEDIAAGYDLDAVKKRFEEKMNPLQYRRPQAAPDKGNVVQAEKIVEKLGIANSLKRRFARLEEVETVWKPQVSSDNLVTEGVFAGIRTKVKPEEQPDDRLSPTVTMTWEKFQRTVLPTAQKIEYLVTAQNAIYGAIVTAEDPDAPPILQWDREDDRCPFSWYLYPGGSPAKQWNLTPGYCEVTAVTLQPNLWRPGFEHNGKAVFFLLQGCRDLQNSSSALFPSTLKGDLHGIRATIEAYSKIHPLSGVEEASACGLRLGAEDSAWKNTFRVTTDLGVTLYKLDRWD